MPTPALAALTLVGADPVPRLPSNAIVAAPTVPATAALPVFNPYSRIRTRPFLFGVVLSNNAATGNCVVLIMLF